MMPTTIHECRHLDLTLIRIDRRRQVIGALGEGTRDAQVDRAAREDLGSAARILSDHGAGRCDVVVLVGDCDLQAQGLELVACFLLGLAQDGRDDDGFDVLGLGCRGPEGQGEKADCRQDREQR